MIRTHTMNFRNRQVIFDTPKVMGILNVTPDSFSDGGKFSELELAIRQAESMVKAGATFIDVGGESTRPGAKAVALNEELDRVIPVIEKISNELDVVVSVDTSKAQVMTEAVQSGAGMINDVRALRNEGALRAAINAAKDFNVPSCLMHMQGEPLSMQDKPQYHGVVEEVMDFFEQRIEECEKAGLERRYILIDPGFGFGKTLDHNYQLLKHIQQFNRFKIPVLVGMSRKSMIGNLLNREVNQRLAGNIATATIAATAGVEIIRVHDVVETMDAIKIVNKLQSIE
ncbi:dihydropteroate synthase [Glaciecola nitratireducens FR1064]|uniref:Dihydropteroate synthase n=2 Tax=Brumicola TaxID=3160924 RepID=G4QGZ0_GLANF|nr:dihydropteroate synthase [Glaciecola nitratireducens FR1064]